MRLSSSDADVFSGNKEGIDIFLRKRQTLLLCGSKLEAGVPSNALIETTSCMREKVTMPIIVGIYCPNQLRPLRIPKTE